MNIRTYDNDYSDSEGYLAAVYIRADKMFDSYERRVTDILTLLGDIGGLQDFFMMIGSLLVGYITQKMFMSTIVKKIYHIRKYENIISEATKKRDQSATMEIPHDNEGGHNDSNLMLKGMPALTEEQI